MMLMVSEEWKQAFPGAGVGLMTLSGVANPDCCAVLEHKKRVLEEEIRARFPNRRAVADYEPVQAYNSYYKRFGQTYHVQHQLESVGFKGKSLPAVAALVEAMFMAELKNGLLTAGHDWHSLQLPLRLRVGHGAGCGPAGGPAPSWRAPAGGWRGTRWSFLWFSGVRPACRSQIAGA